MGSDRVFPDISVLVATRNRASLLAQTLSYLRRQQLDGLSWEIIVIDNGSTDETPEVVASARRGLPIVSLTWPQPGKNRALNRGLDVARGKLLVFTDDDVKPRPDWISTLHAATLRWPDDSIFGGRVDPEFPASTPAWLMREDFPHGRWAFSRFHARDDEGPTPHTPLGPNMAIRASIFKDLRYCETIGPSGDNYAMGSEVELLFRLQARGERFIYVPDAAVRHVVRPDQVEKESLFKRAYRCGRGNARLFPGQGKLPILGVPAYAWRTAGVATARLAWSRFGDQQKRWMAGMAYHQARGGVHERRLMAKEKPHQRLMARVRRTLRWRGVPRFFFMAASKVLRPLVRCTCCQLFEYELDQGVTDPPENGDFTAEVLHGDGAREQIKAALTRLGGLTPERIDERLDRGDVVMIASAGGRAVGFAWLTFQDVWVTEVEATLKVGEREAAGYDGYVRPEWRGRGILPYLDHIAMDHARERGCARHIVYTDVLNRPCLRSMVHMGKRKVMKVASVWLRGREHPWTAGFGAPLSKRFVPSNGADVTAGADAAVPTGSRTHT